jgi:hypothetical protein
LQTLLLGTVGEKKELRRRSFGLLEICIAPKGPAE